MKTSNGQTNKSSWCLTVGSYISFLIVLSSSLVIMNVHLSLGIVLAVIFSLLFNIFNPKRQIGFFVPNLFYIPLVMLILNDAALSNSINNYLVAHGKLIIAIWVGAIIYFFFAIIYRALPEKIVKKIFPPYFIGALLVLLSIVIIGIFGLKFIYAPLENSGKLDYIGITAIVFMVVIFYTASNFPLHHFIRNFRALFAFGFGFFVYLVHDLITVISNLGMDGTLYFHLFTQINAYPTFSFINFIEHFEFYNYLAFDWTLILLVLPIAIISLLNDTQDQIILEDETERHVLPVKRNRAQLDSLVFLNGASSLSTSALGAMPVNLVLADKSQRNKKHHLFIDLSLGVLLVLALIFSFEGVFATIPTPIYFGVLIIEASLILARGVKLIAVSWKEESPLETLLGSSLVLIIGLIFASGYLSETFLGYTWIDLTIGNVKLNFLLLAVSAGLVFNIIYSFIKMMNKKKKEKTATN